MSYAVILGTTSSFWIDNDDTPAGSVRYDGVLPVHPIWDAALGNIREKTAGELQADADAKTALDAIAAQDKIDRQEFKDKVLSIKDDITAIIASQQTYIDAPVLTNAGRDAQLLQQAKNIRQLARDLRFIVNAVKGLA